MNPYHCLMTNDPSQGGEQVERSPRMREGVGWMTGRIIPNTFGHISPIFSRASLMTTSIIFHLFSGASLKTASVRFHLYNGG